MLQTSKHIRGHQVDEVTVEGQLQELPLIEKCPRLQGRDAVVLEVQVMEAAQASQVLKADLHYSVILEEESLQERDRVN